MKEKTREIKREYQLEEFVVVLAYQIIKEVTDYFVKQDP